MKYEINPKFESCIPDLTEEENLQLEENIVRQGEVIEPIILWNGFVVDGHHRLRVIEKHPEITYHTRELSFYDDVSVMNWICKNQLGRRNLTPEQRRFLIGNCYETEKTGRGGKRSNGHDTGGRFAAKSHNDTLRSDEKATMDAAQKIAKEQNISRASVMRAETFYKAVNLADKFFPGVRHRILHGDIELRQADAELIMKTPAEQQCDIVKSLLFPQTNEQNHPEAKTEEAACVNSLTEEIAAQKSHTFNDQEAYYFTKAADLGEKIAPGFKVRFLDEGYRFHQKDAVRIVQASSAKRRAIVKSMMRHPPKEVTLDVDGLFDDIWRCAPALSENELRQQWTSMLSKLTKPFPAVKNKDRSRILARIAISFFTEYLNRLNTNFA